MSRLIVSVLLRVEVRSVIILAVIFWVVESLAVVVFVGCRSRSKAGGEWKGEIALDRSFKKFSKLEFGCPAFLVLVV